MPLHVLAYHLMCDEWGFALTTTYTQQYRFWSSLSRQEQSSLLLTAAQLRKLPTTEHPAHG